MTFASFDREALEFLVELSQNNDRAWFEKNKARYETQVREPALALIRAMKPRLRAVSKELVADDRKIGGSLMRVHRDTRFSKDKSPYKTNVGVQFRHAIGKDVHAPGLYFHIGLDECFLGLGCWRPEPDVLGAIRARIAEQPKKWRAVVEDPALLRYWKQSGESLKRPPKGVAPDHPCVEDLKRKDYILVSELSVKDVTAPGLVDLVIERAATARGHWRFLCAAIGVPG